MVVKALPKKLQPEEIRKVTKPARKAIRKGFALLAKTERLKKIQKECGDRAMWDIDFAGKCMEKLQGQYNTKRDSYLAKIKELEAKGWTKSTISVKPEVLVFVNTLPDSKGEVFVFFDGKDDLFPWEVMGIDSNILRVEEDVTKIMEDYEKIQKKEAKLRKWASTIMSVIISLIPGVGWIISVVLGAIQAIYEYRIASAKTKDMKRTLQIQRDEEIARIKKMEEEYKKGLISPNEHEGNIKTMIETVKDSESLPKSSIGKWLTVAAAGAMVL